MLLQRTTFTSLKKWRTGRLIGEFILGNVDPDLTYAFSIMNPDDPINSCPTEFQVVAGTGNDIGKYFLRLCDDVSFDYENPATHSFVLRLTDGSGQSILQSIR